MPQSESSTGATENCPILLEFDAATLAASDQRFRSLRSVDFRIRGGELALILDPAHRTQQLLGPAAVGLVAAAAGHVRFELQDWQAMPYEVQLARRHRIGRVFSNGGWIDNLTVLDNITLSQRHHTNLSESTITQHAGVHAKRFGLDEIPDARPARVSPLILRKCQWVRAFFPAPKLLVLERPLEGVSESAHQVFLDAEASFRQHGGATLWITDDRQVWSRSHQGEVLRFRVSHEQFESVKGPIS